METCQVNTDLVLPNVFVCKTMRDSCPDVWAANDLNSLGDCEAKLAALPLAEGDDFYIDSNTCASPRA